MDRTVTPFLQDSTALLDAIERCGVGVWRWKVDTNHLDWTRNLEAVHRLPAGSFDGTLASFAQDIHPDDVDAVWTAINEAVASDQPYDITYRTSPHGNSEPVWIHACGATVVVDATKYLTGTCREVTEEVLKEEELRKRLRHLDGITELGSFALGEGDFQEVLNRAVEVAAGIFDVPLTKILQFGSAADRLELKAGLGWKDGLVGNATVGIDSESQAGYTLLAHGPVIVDDLLTEQRFSGPPLLTEHGVRSGMSVVIEGTGARPFGVFGIHDTRIHKFDATDASSLQSLANIIANAARQVEALRRQELLTREIAHRSNNLLQVVGVIARQTFTKGVDPATVTATFGERLSAISRANRLISQGGWMPTRFKELVNEVMLPYQERIETSGRDILLPPKLCFDIGLVLHELATNSIKYGSLGSEAGRISIAWKVTEGSDGSRLFELEWNDPETRPTNHHGTGFGRRLKRSLIEQKWGGTMEIALGERYRFRCSIPLSEIND